MADDWPEERPWLAVEGWRDNRIRSEARSGLRIAWLITALLAAASLPVFIFLPEELEDGNNLALIALAIPLVGLGAVASALRKTLEWRRFGPMALVLDPMPGSLGGDVGGILELGQRYNPGKGLSL